MTVIDILEKLDTSVHVIIFDAEHHRRVSDGYSNSSYWESYILYAEVLEISTSSSNGALLITIR